MSYLHYHQIEILTYQSHRPFILVSHCSPFICFYQTSEMVVSNSFCLFFPSHKNCIIIFSFFPFHHFCIPSQTKSISEKGTGHKNEHASWIYEIFSLQNSWCIYENLQLCKACTFSGWKKITSQGLCQVWGITFCFKLFVELHF